MAKKIKFEVLRSVLLGDDADSSVGDLEQLLELACERDRLHFIDWRGETAGVVNGVDRCLELLCVEGFDWTFLDHLADIGVGEVMRNNNFLCHVRDQLQQIGQQLVHVNRFDDNFYFFVTSPEKFASISGMHKRHELEISDDFGPDEFYLLGMTHLKASGFSQPSGRENREAQEKKRQARRLKSLRKMLDETCQLEKDEAPDSLVPPYARFEPPARVGTSVEDRSWTIYLDSGLYASWLARRASKRILDGDGSAGAHMRTSWELELISRKFLERSYLDATREYGTPDKASGQLSYYDACHYWRLTLAATGFYYIGAHKNWQECASFYPMFKCRFQITKSFLADLEAMQWALIQFLSDEGEGSVRLDQLAKTDPFGPLLNSWRDDGRFAQGLHALFEWHLQGCHQALRGDSEIEVPGYEFFPTWILAIDRNRERVLGRSSLPEHPLMGMTGRYLVASFEGRGDPLVERLTRLYESTYAADPVDLLEVWKSFVGRQ